METRLLIRGEQVAGEGAPLAVENPATEEMVTELGVPSPEQLDAAIAGAREAALLWASTPAVERAEMLHEAATRIRGMTDDLARAKKADAAALERALGVFAELEVELRGGGDVQLDEDTAFSLALARAVG